MEGTDQETTAPTNPQTNANGDNDDEMKQDEIKTVQVEAVDNDAIQKEPTSTITPEDETTSPTTLTNEDDMGTTTATTAMEASMENPSNVDKDTPMDHDDLIDEDEIEHEEPPINPPNNDDEMDDPDQIATAQQTSRQLNEQALFHQMESNYIAVKTERDHLRTLSKTQSDQLAKLQASVLEMQQQLHEQTSSSKQQELTAQTVQQEKLHAEEQTKLYKDQLDQLRMELDQVQTEKTKLVQQTQKYQSDIHQLTSSNEETASSAIPLRYEKERLQTQLENLSSHSHWLETELQTRTKEMTALQTAHSMEHAKLTQEVQALLSNKEQLEIQQTQLEQDKQELFQKVEELHSEGKDQKHIHTNAIRSMEEELYAEQRVSQLLEEKTMRLEDTISNLNQTLDDYKTLASKAVKEEQDRQSQMLLKAQTGMETQLQKVRQLEQSLQEMTHQKTLAEKALQEKHAAEIRRRKLLHDKMTAHQNLAIADGSSSFSPMEIEPDKEKTSDSTLPTIATPVSLTDLYARLAETEDELNSSQTENARLTLYLQKICAEMEGSAPKIRQQQMEYRMALKERDQSQNRLEEALREADSAHREAEDLAEELQLYSKEVKELRVENQDLASQVQILLESRVSENSMKDDETKRDLVGFTNVQEMQEQNQKLLKEHRRLSQQVEELTEKLDQSSLQASLDAAEEELRELQEERTRQTTLVAGIVQQRDLYRALLAKTDQKLLLESEEAPKLLTAQAHESPRKKSTAEEVEERTKLKADLFTANNTIAALEERVKRLDAHSTNLMSSMDKLSQNLTTANASIARSEAEATYHSEKCFRLEESVQALKHQVSLAEKRVADVQNVNADMQKALAEAKTDSSRYELDLKHVMAKNHLMETQLKTAQAAESRLVNETKNLQSELSRRGALLDSVQRIEASLSSRSAQEMQVLEEEIKKLKESAKVAETKQISALEVANDKITSLELNIISLQKDKENAMSLSVKAKDMSLGLQKQVKFLENKTNQLEKDLEEKNEKLKDLTPKTPQTVDANKQKISELTAELESVRKELALTKERAATFQEIAKKTETDLADLTKVTDQFKKEKLDEIETLKSDLNSSRKDAVAKQTALIDLGKDLENQRNEQKESESELKTKIASLENDVENLKKDSDSAKERLSALKAEVDFHRDTALTEQKNYERELDLHSTARSELRSVRSNLDVEQSRRESVEGELKALQFEYNEQKKAWSVEKAKIEDTMKEMDERLEKSREQNNLLHSQMNDLTASVEKFQASRIESATQDEGEGEKSSATEESEIAKLEKSVLELRGIIRYMKSEREIVDAQLDTLRRAVERERATSAIAKRNLDEARVELELLQKRTVRDGGGLNDPTLEANKENENILKKSEEHTTLLQESNALLREESERMRAKLESTQKSLEELKKSLEPSQLKVRELEIDLAAASSEKSSLEKEVEAWKTRMQNFVSKFQMIDPEEHEKALKLAEKLKKELETMKNLKEKADQASTNAKAIISRLNRENSLQKTSIQEVNSKLVKAVAEKDAALKSNASSGAELKKERDQLKKKVEQLDNELKTLKPEHVAVKGRVDNLTKMLKQYKTKMLDLNQQHQASLAKEKETQKALEKEQEALKEKTAALDRVSNKETAKLGTDTKQVEDSKTSSEPPLSENNDKTTVVVAPNVSEKKEIVPKPSVEVPPGGFKFAPSPNVKTAVSVKKATGAAPSEKAKDSTSIHVSKKPKLVKIGKPAATGKALSEQKTDATSNITKEAPTPSSVDKGKETPKKTVVAKKSKIIKLGQSSAVGSKSVGKSGTSALSEPKPEADSKQTTPSKIPAVPDMNSLRAKLMERKRKLNAMVAAAESKKKKEETAKETSSTNPAPVDPPAQKPALGSSSKLVSKVEASDTLPPADATPAAAPTPVQKSIFGTSAKTNPTPIAAIPSTLKPVFGSSNSTIGNVEAKKDLATMSATPITDTQPAQKSFFGSPATTPGKVEASKGQSSESSNPLQATKPTFGFTNTSSTTPAFGSSSNTPTFGNSFGQSTIKPATSTGGGTFLNLKPPGSSSSSAPFTFGTSSTIKLPLPSKPTVTAPKMPFGVFGQTNAPSTSAAFGGTAGSSSLFGNVGIKRSSTSEESDQLPASKQPRAETCKEDGKDDKEEGEE